MSRPDAQTERVNVIHVWLFAVDIARHMHTPVCRYALITYLVAPVITCLIINDLYLKIPYCGQEQFAVGVYI